MFYVKRYIKGISKLRSPRPKYNITWDPQVLLNHLENIYPNEDVSLELSSKKLISLLAIITAHRFQTLSLIKVENIIFTANGDVKIFIPDNIKTSAPGRFQPCLQFSNFLENPKVCVATTLMAYIEKTAELRQENNGEYLFLTYNKPHHRASSQTLSRWVKETLHQSGVNTSIFTAYSIRHTSTFYVYKSGVSINVIRNTAGWSPSSQTFCRFYNKEIISSTNEFAYAILKNRNL